MAKKKQLEVDDACPFPPGVELPRKGRLSTISGSIFADPRFVGSALLVAGMIFILGFTLVPPPIIKIAGEPSIWNATIPNWGGSPVFDTKLKWVPRYSNITTLKGEMILSGEQELKLENGSYSIDGTILVKDKAKLIMRNADISIKYKTGYSGIDQIQTYLNIKLVDEASLEATNSTIFYPQNTASFGFYNNSQCIITNCNMSRVDITGYSESRLELKGSKVNFLGIGENTQLSLNLCSVYGVYPDTYALEGFNGGVALKTGKLVLDASNSNITQVSTFYRNSTITVDHSINGYHEKWSSWDIAEGGDGFEISLVRCNVSNIVVCVEGGEAEVSNVHDLYGLEVLWGKVRVVNSTLPWVAAGGGGVIEGCVIGVFDVIDGNYSLSRSRFRELYMNPVNDEIVFSRMKLYSISGNYVNCSLSGDLMIENATDCRLLGHSKISRSYPVQVLNGDRAAPGVNLSLYNSTDDVLWSGKTDDLGKANVSITFYQNLRVGGPETPRFPDKLRLVAFEGSDQKEATLELTSSTPILIAFPMLVKPVWTQGWFLQLFSAGLALAIVFAFLLSRRRGTTVTVNISP